MRPGSGRRTRWARRGTRPAASTDQRTASTYIFGAICPALGKGAALILPHCNTVAMNLHLAEIAQTINPGAHAVLLVDQAGWHLSHRLMVPPNITIVPLPPKCPELNPVENIWQYMRGNWLSNRVFLSYTNIVDHCCDTWKKLIAQPWTIMSVGLGNWAYGFWSMSIGIRYSMRDDAFNATLANSISEIYWASTVKAGTDAGYCLSARTE